MSHSIKQAEKEIAIFKAYRAAQFQRIEDLLERTEILFTKTLADLGLEMPEMGEDND